MLMMCTNTDFIIRICVHECVASKQLLVKIIFKRVWMPHLVLRMCPLGLISSISLLLRVASH